MPKNKRIGIMGWVLGERTFGVSKSYLNYISKFGKPVILTPEHTELEELDLIVLSGGADVNPSSYGKAPTFYTGEPNVMLEWFDNVMLPKYMEQNVPVLGICRGAQSLWAHAGGDIVQHNPFHKQSEYNTDLCHGLVYTEPFKHLTKLLSKVNSRHHQTIDASNSVPEGYEVMAYATETANGKPDDTIVELFRHITKPIFGIQSHPEDMLFSDRLIPTVINQFLNP